MSPNVVMLSVVASLATCASSLTLRRAPVVHHPHIRSRHVMTADSGDDVDGTGDTTGNPFALRSAFSRLKADYAAGYENARSSMKKRRGVGDASGATTPVGLSARDWLRTIALSVTAVETAALTVTLLSAWLLVGIGSPAVADELLPEIDPTPASRLVAAGTSALAWRTQTRPARLLLVLWVARASAARAVASWPTADERAAYVREKVVQCVAVVAAVCLTVRAVDAKLKPASGVPLVLLAQGGARTFSRLTGLGIDHLALGQTVTDVAETVCAVAGALAAAASTFLSSLAPCRWLSALANVEAVVFNWVGAAARPVYSALRIFRFAVFR